MSDDRAAALLAALDVGECSACKRTHPPGGLQMSRNNELICQQVGSCLNEIATRIINQHERKNR